MNKLSTVLVILALLSGCSTEPDVPPSDVSTESAAIVSLNEQIEQFNAERPPGNTGISPIDRRVLRIEREPTLDQLACFDKDGKPFLILKREPDGRFEGTLEVEFHELPGSGPDGSHSWGHVLAEFYLEILLKNKAALTRSFRQTVEDREVFAAALATLPCVDCVYPSGADFILVRTLADRPAMATLVAGLLSEHSIYIKDVTTKMSDPGGRYFRFAVRLPEENARLVEAIRAWDEQSEGVTSGVRR